MNDTAIGADLIRSYPLTLNQEFLRAFDKGDEQGAFSNLHTLVGGWRLSGPVRLPELRAALDDVVARHEVLRSAVSRSADTPVQVVHPPMSAVVTEVELSDVGPQARSFQAEAFLNKVETRPFAVAELPLVRADLGRFDTEDAVLVVQTHHTATDAWSMQVLIRDLANCYARRCGHEVAALPEAQPYRDFAAWQAFSSVQPAATRAREYWRDKLTGARIVGLPNDRPRPADGPSAYAAHRFLIEPAITSKALELARASRVSPFMVLLSAYAILVRDLTGVSDLVIPTFSAGRSESRFEDSVGPFFNFLPLRLELADCRTPREVIIQTRRTCLDAYTHELPFAELLQEAPELAAVFADDSQAVFAFEALQGPPAMNGALVGDLRYSEIRERTQPQQVASGIPDGGLWALDVLPSGWLAGSLKFDANQFDEASMTRMAERFRQALSNTVNSPDESMQ